MRNDPNTEFDSEKDAKCEIFISCSLKESMMQLVFNYRLERTTIDGKCGFLK